MLKESWGKVYVGEKSEDLTTYQIKIGRSEDCHIRINDPRVSTSHCRLEYDGKRCFFINLSFCNSYVGQTQVTIGEKQIIKDGSEIFLLRSPKLEDQIKFSVRLNFVQEEEETILPETQIQSSLNSNSEQDDLTCSICLQIFQRAGTLQCGHSFCADCLQTWSRQGNRKNCPVCRQPIKRFELNDTLNQKVEEYYEFYPDQRPDETEKIPQTRKKISKMDRHRDALCF